MALASQVRPPAPPTLNEVFEAGQQLVGLLLAESAVYGRVAKILHDEDWARNLHRGVFEVAGGLTREGRPILLEAVLPRVSDMAPDGDTRLDEDVFSSECPYTIETVMNRPVSWPPESGES